MGGTKRHTHMLALTGWQEKPDRVSRLKAPTGLLLSIRQRHKRAQYGREIWTHKWHPESVAWLLRKHARHFCTQTDGLPFETLITYCSVLSVKRSTNTSLLFEKGFNELVCRREQMRYQNVDACCLLSYLIFLIRFLD